MTGRRIQGAQPYQPSVATAKVSQSEMSTFRDPGDGPPGHVLICDSHMVALLTLLESRLRSLTTQTSLSNTADGGFRDSGTVFLYLLMQAFPPVCCHSMHQRS